MVLLCVGNTWSLAKNNLWEGSLFPQDFLGGHSPDSVRRAVRKQGSFVIDKLISRDLCKQIIQSIDSLQGDKKAELNYGGSELRIWDAQVKASVLAEDGVEMQMLEFIKEFVPLRTSPMCGNSICQDRRFLARWMPQLEAYFHYRNLDVSTLKELAKRWKPEVAQGIKKHGKHEALADIYESINEMKHYREHFIRL